MWIPDEDFPLFLKSLYETARAVLRIRFCHFTDEEDRLLFGIVPLFERRVVQVKMRIENSENAASGGPVDVGLWIKLIPETGSYVYSINIRQ